MDSRGGRVHNLSVARSSARASSVLVLLAILAAACGANQKPAALPRTTSTTGKVAVVLEAVGVSVTPSHNLHDGQQVKVSIKGFPPGWKVFVSECITPSEANPLGCGGQLARQPSGFSDHVGNGSIPVVVHSSAATSPYNATLSPCSGECVIVATTGVPVGTPVHGVYFMAPITFAPTALPPQAGYRGIENFCAVSPLTGTIDYDGISGGLVGVLTVSVGGLPPDDEVFVNWSNNHVRAPVIADFRTDSGGKAIQSSVDVGRLGEMGGVQIVLSAASVPNPALGRLEPC